MFDSTIDISNGTSLAALIIVGCSALFPVKDKRSNLPLGYFSFKLSASSSIVWLASIFCTNLLVTACFGCSNNCFTVPSSTIFPSLITAIRVQIFCTTSIWCVIITIVIPKRRLISLNNSRICSVVSGSSADVASSHSRILGEFANALAIPTLCF